MLKIGDAADRDTIERVHGFHAVHCTVARSIRGDIDVSTELMLVPYGRSVSSR